MLSSAPTWSIGDLGLPVGGQSQQVRANAAFVLGAPPFEGSMSKGLKPAASGGRLIKSLSTPRLRRPSTMSEPDTGKNRSRLGYQRTTIACVHCRRRKIRCVVQDNEPGQKCINCARLKRECRYQQVDQLSALETPEKSTKTPKVPSTASSAVSSSPPPSKTPILGQSSEQFGGHQSLRLQARPPTAVVPILPSTSLANAGSFSAPIPQRAQFGTGQCVPERLAYPVQPTYGPQTWDPRETLATYPQHTHVLQESGMNLQHAYSARNNPALQADTAPFPPSADFTQPEPPYSDAGHYNHELSSNLVSQQWQQQEHPPYISQYHQPGIYHVPPQHEYQQHGNYSLPSDPHFIAMAPGHVPQPVQHPHPVLHPSQNSPLPAGYFLPSQQATTSWPPGLHPPTPLDNGTYVRHPEDHPAGHG